MVFIQFHAGYAWCHTLGQPPPGLQQYIRDLPLELEFTTAAGNLLLCHGLGKKTMAKVRDDDEGYALENNFELQDLIKSRRCRFLINGHTHYKMVRNFGSMTVINAGSLLYEDAGFMTLDFEARLLRFYTLSLPAPVLSKEQAF
jgi:predicted phosphodiesterase